MPRESEKQSLKCNLRESIAVIGQCQWLIDSYVLDFYTENHWQQLPSSWRAVFDNLKDVAVFSEILNLDDSADKSPTAVVLPLSLLALNSCIRKLSAARRAPSITKVPLQKNPLKHLYKKVNAKKCHEIDRMAELTASTALQCQTEYVVDFGAGLGHLARLLAFQHRIKICCLEQQEKLSNEARWVMGLL